MPSVLMRTCPGKGLGTAPRSLRPSTVSTLRALGADSLAGRWSALRGAPLGRDNPSLRASVRALGTDPVSSTQEQPGALSPRTVHRPHDFCRRAWLDSDPHPSFPVRVVVSIGIARNSARQGLSRALDRPRC